MPRPLQLARALHAAALCLCCWLLAGQSATAVSPASSRILEEVQAREAAAADATATVTTMPTAGFDPQGGPATIA